MKSTRVQTLLVLAAGALLGGVAASGNFLSGRQADASPASGSQGDSLEVIVFQVRLPADAVLLIDDNKTEETGEARRFRTPPLPVGRHYAYTLKATSNGKEVTRTIHLAHGLDNTFDLRAEFRPAAAGKPHARTITGAGSQKAPGGAAPVQVTGVPGSPGATTTIPGNQLPPLPPRFEGKIERNAAQSKPWWPPRVVPPRGAPTRGARRPLSPSRAPLEPGRLRSPPAPPGTRPPAAQAARSTCSAGHSQHFPRTDDTLY
jgi:uncharacterized protein (TIGR03000 family)